jgi:hypothetical protein
MSGEVARALSTTDVRHSLSATSHSLVIHLPLGRGWTGVLLVDTGAEPWMPLEVCLR